MNATALDSQSDIAIAATAFFPRCAEEFNKEVAVLRDDVADRLAKRLSRQGRDFNDAEPGVRERMIRDEIAIDCDRRLYVFDDQSALIMFPSAAKEHFPHVIAHASIAERSPEKLLESLADSHEHMKRFKLGAFDNGMKLDPVRKLQLAASPSL